MDAPVRRSRRLALALMGAGLLLLVGAAACRSPAVGLVDGRLAPCPSSPNCVCSQDDPQAGSAIAPLTLHGDAATEWRRLHGLLAGWPRVTVVADDGRWLHAEFRTAWLRFTDDVEFLLDEPAGAIQVRSASRLGWSDLGANRRRIEALRAAWDDGAADPDGA